MDQYDLATRGDTEGLWDWDLASNRVHFAPRWISIMGYDERDVGNTPEEWLGRVHPEDLGKVQADIDAHVAAGPDEFDIRHRMLHKDGKYRWMWCRGVVVRDASGRAVRVMGSHVDITAETVTDAQTGLPNRLLLVDRLTRSIERARRHDGFQFAVLLVDLDRSEARGADQTDSTAGDPLLTAAARRLETCLRGGDTEGHLGRYHLVAHLRGDEFAVLLDGLQAPGDARIVADRVLAEILAPFTVGGREVFLSASIGIALSATGYERAEDVLRDADTAVYRAKLLGRARCEVFDTAILTSAESELRLEADLKDAIERRQFVVHYQPIVSLASNRIAGFEALVRWQHPSLGLIPPVEFIPIAERTGLIVPLGAWILREACLQLKAWQESLPIPDDLWVSVNLSSPQFSHPGLVEQIGESLHEVGLEARCLMLELTEGVAMENPTAVKGLLMKLRVMGARVGLDDFGTGQSSLAYLHQFPADFLKVDRAFVRDMEAHSDVRDIVAAITGLARQLGLRVIAEGIETEEQLARVRSLGCEYGQGFLFSRPVDKERAAELLTAAFAADRIRTIEAGPASGSKAEAPRNGRGRHGFAARHRRPLFVAASVVIVLACAGVIGRLSGRPSLPPPAPSAPSLAVQQTALKAPPETAALKRAVVKPAPDIDADAPWVGPSIRSTESTPPELAPRLPAAVIPAAKAMTYSLAVVHKHTLKDCQGVLTATPEGVAFLPDKVKGKAGDGFTFGYGDFLFVLSDDQLTIKSSAKTYRFKAADATSKDDNRFRLQQLVDTLTRLRPAAAAK